MWEAAKLSGHPKFDVSSGARLTALCNRRLQSFTSSTLCLWSDGITVTLTTNSHTYSLLDTAVFSQALAKVTEIALDGVPLRRLRRPFEGYLQVAAGRPEYWWPVLPNHVRLSRTPSGVTETVLAAGHVIEPAHVKDTETISVPDRFLDDAFRHCAIPMLEPPGSKEATLAVNRLIQLDAARVAEIQASCDFADHLPGYRTGGA